MNTLIIFAGRIITRSIVIVVLVFCGSSLVVFAQAQATFLLRDTVVQRGSVVRIALRLQLNNLPPRIDSIRFALRYTPSLLLPERTNGGAGNLLLCPQPATTIQFASLNLSTLIITCNQVQQRSGGPDTLTICSIDFRTLAAADSIAVLDVENLAVNGVNSNLLGMQRIARVRIQGEPLVAGRFDDIIGEAFPNPAPQGIDVQFPYTLAETSVVQFSVFSLRGEEIYRFAELRQTQGSYNLRYTPAPSLANGLYSLRMTTPRGVYRRSFMILR